MRRMFGHIGGSTAVFPTHCQTLQQTKRNQDDWRCHANTGIGGQNTHNKGRQTHDQNGHQEGVFATDHVAQAAKEYGTERTHDKTRRKREQRKDEGRTLVQTTEELLGDDGCE